MIVQQPGGLSSCENNRKHWKHLTVQIASTGSETDFNIFECSTWNIYYPCWVLLAISELQHLQIFFFVFNCLRLGILEQGDNFNIRGIKAFSLIFPGSGCYWQMRIYCTSLRILGKVVAIAFRSHCSPCNADILMKISDLEHLDQMMISKHL